MKEDCFLCDATGVIMNDDGDIVRCPDCKGTRVVAKRKASHTTPQPGSER